MKIKILSILVLFFLLLSFVSAVETAILRNNYIRVVQEKIKNRYFIATIDGVPTIAGDDNKQILSAGKKEKNGLFGSFTTIVIDGKEYVYGDDEKSIISNATALNGEICSSVKLGDIVIYQTLSLVKSISHQFEHSVRLMYVVSNSGVESHDVSIRIYQDLAYSGKDLFRFRVPGWGVLLTESVFSNEIPYKWYAYESFENIGLSIESRLDIPLSEDITRLVFADDSKFKRSLYKVDIDSDDVLDDPGVGIYFENLKMESGRRRRVGLDIGFGVYSAFSNDNVMVYVGGSDLIENGRPALISVDAANISRKSINGVAWSVEPTEKIVEGIGTVGNGSFPRKIDNMIEKKLTSLKKTDIIKSENSISHNFFLSVEDGIPNGFYGFAVIFQGNEILTCPMKINVQNFFTTLFSNVAQESGPTEAELKLLDELKKEILYSGYLSEKFLSLIKDGMNVTSLSNTSLEQDIRDEDIISLRKRVLAALGEYYSKSKVITPKDDDILVEESLIEENQIEESVEREENSVDVLSDDSVSDVSVDKETDLVETDTDTKESIDNSANSQTTEEADELDDTSEKDIVEDDFDL